MPQPNRFDPSIQQPIDHRRCPVCGRPMFLSLIEPYQLGYDMHKFECVSCAYAEFTFEATEGAEIGDRGAEIVRTAQEYRKRAEQCLEMAERASTQTARKTWNDMAASWLDLARNAPETQKLVLRTVE
jgi:hypothetical protein